MKVWWHHKWNVLHLFSNCSVFDLLVMLWHFFEQNAIFPCHLTFAIWSQLCAVYKNQMISFCFILCVLQIVLTSCFFILCLRLLTSPCVNVWYKVVSPKNLHLSLLSFTFFQQRLVHWNKHTVAFFLVAPLSSDFGATEGPNDQIHFVGNYPNTSTHWPNPSNSDILQLLYYKSIIQLI